MDFAGLSFGKRNSAGGLTLASYHPRKSGTWYWSLTLERQRYAAPLVRLEPKERRRGQWHHCFRLPFGWSLIWSQQDYHRGRAA